MGDTCLAAPMSCWDAIPGCFSQIQM